MIASGAVSSGHVASGAVTADGVASGQIQSFALGSGAVLSGRIASGQVGQFHVASGSVTSGRLGVAGTPDGTLFLRDDFNWAAPAAGGLVSGSVQSGHVASGAIQGFFGATRHIASGTVGAFDFGSGAVVAGSIGSGAVLSGHIGSGQVGTSHLADESVASGDVASGSLSTFKVASGGFLSGAIGSGQVGNAHIGSGAVLSGHLASGQVGQFHIASGAVSSGRLGVTTAPDGTKFLRDDFTWQNPPGGGLSSGSVQSGHIGDAAVVSGSVASGQIARVHLSSGVQSWGMVEVYTAAELISGVKAVALHRSGGGNEIVRAERASGFRLPVLGVAVSGAASGQACDVIVRGRVLTAASGMIASGFEETLLYCGSGGLLVNQSGFMGGASSGAPFLSGNIQQAVGWSISGGVLVQPMDVTRSGFRHTMPHLG